MPLNPVDKIERQIKMPRHVELWRALQPLKSCVSFMNTGAHPDDETSAMLSLLNLRHGMSMSFACANRGEGGQNDVGTEVSENLGVVRTAEMERAADELGLRLYWLSESPEDSIFDFGFSKSGVDTLSRWGHQRTLDRMVTIIRQERPDILCTTFLDVPGQHGHHRAMTEIALQAVSVAADCAVNTGSLPAWQVRKCYLPAWSGAGDAYDDDLPPPAATLTISGQGEDAITGWTYEQLGQQSRAMHKTQGMGRWITRGQERDWPLHLATSSITEPDTSIIAGLPASLGTLATYAGAQSIQDALTASQNSIDAALEAFPDYERIRKAASQAVSDLRLAMERCPEAARHEVMHRLALKEQQLAKVIRLSARASVSGWLDKDKWRPGDQAQFHHELFSGDAERVSVNLKHSDDWTVQGNTVTLATHAPIHDPYPSSYLPEQPRLPAIEITVCVDGIETQTLLPLDTPPVVLPDTSAHLSPPSRVLNMATSQRTVDITVSETYPAHAETSLQVPPGWRCTRTADGYSITAPEQTKTRREVFPLLVDGEETATVHRFAHSHINPCARAVPAVVTIQTIDALITPTRIGYVGGGNDTVFQRLQELGFTPFAVSDDMLASAQELSRFDTILVGVFAFRTRAALQRNLNLLHDWVQRGGNLVTLYHRPSDAWDPDKVPPLPLTIGKPSLRYRVTDENAAVTHLLPDHPLLNTPNIINETDWQGWHKERGLYFAKSWDPSYAALLSMADPDESAHKGALLSARVGKGRHTHTSLILHHQMEKLVPGAYRLMANLVAAVAT